MSRTAVDGGSLLVPSCLERPQAVSGCLMSAATYNQPFRMTGASSRCSWSSRLKQLHGMWHRRGGWRPIATNDKSKIRAWNVHVKIVAAVRLDDIGCVSVCRRSMRLRRAVGALGRKGNGDDGR